MSQKTFSGTEAVVYIFSIVLAGATFGAALGAAFCGEMAAALYFLITTSCSCFIGMRLQKGLDESEALPPAKDYLLLEAEKEVDAYLEGLT